MTDDARHRCEDQDREASTMPGGAAPASGGAQALTGAAAHSVRAAGRATASPSCPRCRGAGVIGFFVCPACHPDQA